MVKQVIDIDGYWEVVVLYDLDYNLFDIVYKELKTIGARDKGIQEIYEMLHDGYAKAVTYSNLSRHRSVVVFNKHHSRRDYINSLVHEAEHVKQAMLEAYDVEDIGEPPAYTIGYLVGRMWEVFKNFVCSF